MSRAIPAPRLEIAQGGRQERLAASLSRAAARVFAGEARPPGLRR